MLIVARHAHAGSRSAWDGDDHERPLSARGMAEAFGIADVLSWYEPTRVVSSPLVRCRQTVEPLAGRIGVPVEVDVRIAEGASVKESLELVKELGGAVAVLCTHGDVVPGLLQAFRTAGMRTDGDLVWPKASCWVVDFDGGSPTTGSYLPPPAVGS